MSWNAALFAGLSDQSITPGRGSVKLKGDRTMVMKSLLTSSAVALVLCAAPAYAQQQKEGMPGGNATGGEGRAAQGQTEKGSAQKGGETSQPKNAQGESKGQSKGAQNEPQGKSKSSAESQQKEPSAKGTAQSQPKDQGGK